jgi:hypothetical protein
VNAWHMTSFPLLSCYQARSRSKAPPKQRQTVDAAAAHRVQELWGSINAFGESELVSGSGAGGLAVLSTFVSHFNASNFLAWY